MLSDKLERKTKYFRRNAEGGMLRPKLESERKQRGKASPPHGPEVTNRTWSGQSGGRTLQTEVIMGAKHESENRDPKEESTGHIGKGLEYQPEHEGPHT